MSLAMVIESLKMKPPQLPPAPTLGSNLPSAELCRRNGWVRGTVLIASERGEVLKIRITAVGDGKVFAREVFPCEEGVEFDWDLSARDWRRA